MATMVEKVIEKVDDMFLNTKVPQFTTAANLQEVYEAILDCRDVVASPADVDLCEASFIACRDLPPEWDIEIRLEKGAGGIVLLNRGLRDG